MFFSKKPKDGADDTQFDKLDELVGQSPVEEGIRKALLRDDLTPEDRREFEEALKRLQEHKPSE